MNPRSVGIVDGTPMLDLAYTEDSSAEVDMNLVKTGAGLYVEVQGTAEALPFGRESLNQLLGDERPGIGMVAERIEQNLQVRRPRLPARNHKRALILKNTHSITPSFR